MCLLSIISFLSLPIPLDSITWQVSSGWEQESFESWTLDAPSAGIYRVYGCTVDPFEELTLDMRWRQDLFGLNNNNSLFFMSEPGLPVSPGTYLVVLQIEHLSKKLINRGLIQVGYY